MSDDSDCCCLDPSTCRGSTWRCQTCGESFCEAHWHRTDLGENVECAGCEYQRVNGE